MANQRLQDSWTIMKSNIRAIWGEDLCDDTLKKGRKDLNKMIDIIHEHTGKSRLQIRTQMNALL